MKAKGKTMFKFVNNEMREYTLYELIDKYDPILKTPTKLFDFENPEIDPYKLGSSMAETMVKYRGIGLSANQIGIPYRVFCMSLSVGADSKTMNIMVLFNPKVVSVSDRTITREEGCLSYPNLYLNVERPRTVTIEFQTPGGEAVTQSFAGLDARVALHELDHLDGKLFTDSVGPVALRLAREKIKKRRKMAGA